MTDTSGTLPPSQSVVGLLGFEPIAFQDSGNKMKKESEVKKYEPCFFNPGTNDYKLYNKKEKKD